MGGENPPPFQDDFASLGASLSPLNKPPEDREEWLADLMGGKSAPAPNTGGTIMVENYMDLNPQLREDVDMVLSLIEREVKARTQRGEPVDITEYLRRFPSQEKEIRALFERVKAQAASSHDTSPSIERNTPPKYESSMGPTTSPGTPPMPTPSRRGGPSSMSSMASVHVMQAARDAGYDILSELGRGGMGVVYKAQQLGLKRMVALKMILAGAHASAEQMARFRAEAEAVAKLQHPNIVQVYDVGEIDGNPFLALEFVDGGSMEDKLKGQPMPPLQAAMLVEPLARAAHVAHQLNIVHRDLKPANILLTSDGTPKISDFGLAKHMDDSSGWTRTGDIMGTPCYMAPEQAEGKIKKIGGPTDVYSLGAILYELLTARPPFLGSSTLETLEQVRSLDPFPVSKFAPNVPRDLETITMKCLEKEPKNRYESGEALADDLKRFLCDEPILAKPPGLTTRLGRWSKRNPTAAAAWGTFILLLLIAAAAVPVLLKESEKNKDNAIKKELEKEKTNPSTSGSGDTPKAQPSEKENTGTLPKDNGSKTPGNGSAPKASSPQPTPSRRPDPPPPPPKPKTYRELIELAQKAKTKKEALENYVKAFRAEDKPATGPVQEYRELLEPALSLVPAVPSITEPDLVEGIAAIYGRKGDLIRRDIIQGEFDDAKVFGRDAREEALDAYAKAIEFQSRSKRDRVLAEYHTRRGLILANMLEAKKYHNRRDVLRTQLDQDAEAAVAIDDSFAGGWNLRGFTHYQKFQDASKAQKAKFLNDAIKAFSQAIDNAQKTDEQYASYFVNRANAYTQLGFLLDQKEPLLKAKQDAEKATKAADSNVLAWMALGGACELLTEYDAANKAFEKQFLLWQTNADAKANLGRVQAKWFYHTMPPNLEHLEKGLSQLQEALRKMPEDAGTNYWLGRLLLSQVDLQEQVGQYATIFLGWPPRKEVPADAAKGYKHLAVAFDDATLGDLFQKEAVFYYSSHFHKPMPRKLLALLNAYLPIDNKKLEARHARFLMERAGIIFQYLPKDLEQTEPRAIKEAQLAFELSKDDEVKAAALDIVVQAQWRLVEMALTQRDRERFPEREKAALQSTRELIKKYPKFVYWKDRAEFLLNTLENAVPTTVGTKAQRKLLEEALEIARAIRSHLAEKKASVVTYDQRIGDIRRKLSELPPD
jgi:serine/threonine protein kinase